MKLTDLSMTASLAPPPDLPSRDPAKAASQLFAQMLVREVRRALPEGGLLGSGDLAPLETLLDEALAEHLARHDALRIEHLFEPRGERRGRSLATHGPVTSGRVTSAFGPRSHPLDGRLHHHDGVDIGAPEGTPVRAAKAGTVRVAEHRRGYGNVVVIDHGDGLETRYAHCRELDVRPGDRVDAGQAIGTVGQTGSATGPHVHFEVRQHGVAVDPTTTGWGGD